MSKEYEIPVNADGKRRCTFAVENDDAAAIAVIGEYLQTARARGWLTRTETIRYALHYTAQAISEKVTSSGAGAQ